MFKTIPSESWSYLIALQFLIGWVSLLKLEQERLSFLSIFRINKAMTFSDLDMRVSGAAQIECHVSHFLHYRFHAELLSLHKVKDNRGSEQAVASEGCIIQVRGYENVPFAPNELESVRVNHKRWNFRDSSHARNKSRAASA